MGYCFEVIHHGCILALGQMHRVFAKREKERKEKHLCWEPGTIYPFSLDIASEYIQTCLRILWIMYCSFFFFFLSCFNLGVVLVYGYFIVYFTGLFLLRGTILNKENTLE